jgi:peroxiredoxin
MALSSSVDDGNDGTAVDASPAPELPKDAVWLQGGPLKWADLRGRVVVLHFWTNGCINCIHNYPTYRSWHEKYAKKDLTIIGVHTPEFEAEAPAERVRRKAKENDLKFPILLDTKARVWRAWGNRYWPSIYLIDKAGRVRYRWEGELHLDTAEGRRFAAHIDDLLAEKR